MSSRFRNYPLQSQLEEVKRKLNQKQDEEKNSEVITYNIYDVLEKNEFFKLSEADQKERLGKWRTLYGTKELQKMMKLNSKAYYEMVHALGMPKLPKGRNAPSHTSNSAEKKVIPKVDPTEKRESEFSKYEEALNEAKLTGFVKNFIPIKVLKYLPSDIQKQSLINWRKDFSNPEIAAGLEMGLSTLYTYVQKFNLPRHIERTSAKPEIEVQTIMPSFVLGGDDNPISEIDHIFAQKEEESQSIGTLIVPEEEQVEIKEVETVPVMETEKEEEEGISVDQTPVQETKMEQTLEIENEIKEEIYFKLSGLYAGTKLERKLTSLATLLSDEDEQYEIQLVVRKK